MVSGVCFCFPPSFLLIPHFPVSSFAAVCLLLWVCFSLRVWETLKTSILEAAFTCFPAHPNARLCLPDLLCTQDSSALSENANPRGENTSVSPHLVGFLSYSDLVLSSHSFTKHGQWGKRLLPVLSPQGSWSWWWFLCFVPKSSSRNLQRWTLKVPGWRCRLSLCCNPSKIDTAQSEIKVGERQTG